MNNFGIELLVNVVASIIVGFGSASLAFWIERKRRADLHMKIEHERPLFSGDMARIHVRIIVENAKMRFFERNPALACQAGIKFFHLDRTPLSIKSDGTVKEMPGRWACTPEPIKAIRTPEGQVTGMFVEEIPAGIDLPPGRSCALDVAVRFTEDEKCYGWNNDSYFRGFRNSEWELPKGRYIVQIIITTGGREFIQEFQLLNDTEFRLIEFLPQQSGAR